MYEKGAELSQLKIQHWLSNEVFSVGWFIELGILIIFYVVWFILLDKKRAKDLIFFGALAAVFFHIYLQALTEVYNFVEYKITLLPFRTEIFISVVTLAPIILMLVQQYTKSWKGYILWSAVGIAVMDFGIFLLFVSTGALQFHKNWNLFYHYLALYAIALFTRLIFLWVAGIQKRFVEKKQIQ